jgi:hypothetical protein
MVVHTYIVIVVVLLQPVAKTYIRGTVSLIPEEKNVPEVAKTDLSFLVCIRCKFFFSN